MDISILTLFPEMFSGPFDHSILKRAQEKGTVTLHIVNIRDFAEGTYKTVDDRPFGGGPGMILRVDVIDRALKSIKNQTRGDKTRTVLLDAGGTPYKQEKARKFAPLDHLILICGHYEGVDERVRRLVDEELSIGDYVLTGGEIPAMVVADSVVRLLPGVLKKEEATTEESFSGELVEYPQYTQPRSFNGMDVPEILLSGNHKAIQQWRLDQAKKRTAKRSTD